VSDEFANTYAKERIKLFRIFRKYNQGRPVRLFNIVTNYRTRKSFLILFGRSPERSGDIVLIIATSE